MDNFFLWHGIFLVCYWFYDDKILGSHSDILNSSTSSAIRTPGSIASTSTIGVLLVSKKEWSKKSLGYRLGLSMPCQLQLNDNIGLSTGIPSENPSFRGADFSRVV